MSRYLLALLALTASAAFSHDHTHGPLVIGHPWSRPTAPGVPTGVAYLSITNNGPTEEVLLGARSPAAARVELHQTIVSEGMARMRPLPQIAIAPGATVRIAPGGIHFMLFDLEAPLSLGDEVPLTLIFREAGDVEVAIKVEARDTAAIGDARVRYEFAEHWTAALGVDNLGNERYWAFPPYARRSYNGEIAARL